MLARITATFENAEQLLLEPEEPETIDLDESYRAMGLIRRIVVLLNAWLTGRDRLSVVEIYVLKDLRRKVASAIPSGYDTVRDQLRPESLTDFEELTKHARHFSPVLGRVMGRERQPFIAFLAGLHNEDIQQRLMAETDSFRISAAKTELKEFEVKREALAAMERITGSIPAEKRQHMYRDVRCLHHLLALSSFPFDRITGGFMPVASGEPVPLPLGRVANELLRLASIIVGMRPGPTLILHEALSLYEQQEQLSQDDEDVEGIIQRRVESYRDAFSKIASFASRYPVADLVRIAQNNIHFRPSPLSGGEDWFAQWKTFWKERVDATHRHYSFRTKLDELVGQARARLDLDSVTPFPGYPPSDLDDPARHGLSLGVLRSFYGETYPNSIEEPLTVLYRDGEFYKPDNRRDVDETFREIEKIQTDIANLEVRLRPTGDLGMSWQQGVAQESPDQSVKDRLAGLAGTIDHEASAILRRAIEAFRMIANVLQGVLFGTVGGRFDTVSNLGQLGGKAPTEYLQQLELANTRSQSVADILSELLNAESLR